jgi:hypothetical protein
MKTLIAIVLAVTLTGCVSPKKGATWYNPGTWFKHSEATATDKARAATAAASTHERTASELLIKDAQKDIAATGEAIAAAPSSPPTALAKTLNARAGDSITAAIGGLAPDALASIRRMVADALSDDAKRRLGGEKALAARDAENSALAQQLSETRAALSEAEGKLRAKEADLRQAFDRENALANAYRNERFLRWAAIIGGSLLTLICAAGWVYVRFALGGIPQALGKGMAVLRAKDPEAATIAEQIFDGLLNRSEQQRISKHS